MAAEPAEKKPFVRIARGDLRGLDELSVDALAIPMFSSKKQPLGAAGAIDWRMCGRIGRLIRESKFLGRTGEALLMSALGRLGAKRIFLLGFGAPHELATPDAMVDIVRAVDVLGEAGVSVLGFAPPVMPGDPLPPRAAMSARKEAAVAKQEGPVEATFSARATLAWIAASSRGKRRFEEQVLLDPDGSLEQARPQLAEVARKSGYGWQ